MPHHLNLVLKLFISVLFVSLLSGLSGCSLDSVWPGFGESKSNNRSSRTRRSAPSMSDFKSIVREGNKARNQCDAYDPACVKKSFTEELTKLKKTYSRSRDFKLQLAVTERIYNMTLEASALEVPISDLYSQANRLSSRLLSRNRGKAAAYALRADILSFKGNRSEVKKLAAKCLELEPSNRQCRRIK